MKNATPPDLPSPLRSSRAATVSLADLRPPPWSNPRAKIRPEDVRGLADTIGRFGLLHPIVVTPTPENEAGGFWLLAGFRRVAALELLGQSSAPANVLEFKDQRDVGAIAREVAIVENRQREDLDPLRESAVVQELLARPGQTIEGVAADLGKPPAWVVRRANLSKLSKGAVAARKAGGPFADWPSSWLEDLALLEDKDQDALVDSTAKGGNVIANRAQLRALVRERLASLGAAPWDLEDAELVPRAGSCAACTKHTAARPGLFEDVKAGALKDSRCLDAACFAGKLAAWRELAIARAKAKHGDELVLMRGPRLQEREHRDADWWTAGEIAADAGLSGSAALEHEKSNATAPTVRAMHEFDEVKKGSPGAVPALVVDGAGVGKVQWVKARASSSGRPKAASTKGKKKSLEDRRAALDVRRKHAVVVGARKFLEGFEGRLLAERKDSGGRTAERALLDRVKASPETLLGFVAAWGCPPPPENEPRGKRPDFAKARLEFLRSSTRLEEVLQNLFVEFERVLGNNHAIFDAERCHGEAAAIFGFDGLGIPDEFAKLCKAAEKEIPEPKSWAIEELASGAPAKKKGRAKKKAATEESARPKAEAATELDRLERALEQARRDAAPKKRGRPRGKSTPRGELAAKAV